MPAVELELRVLRRLGDLTSDWDRLAAAQLLPSPFLRSWWLEHTAEGEPVLLCWLAQGRLVGGVALERDRPGRGPLSVERFRCLGQGVLAPDHLDLIATAEHRDEVADALVAWMRRPGSRWFDLDGLAADGALATVLGERGTERTAAPFAVLPADMDEYLAARPGRVRSTVSRTAKRLAREGVVHRAVGPDDAGRALDDLALLHEGRWAEESAFLSAWDRFRAAAAAGMRAGEVTIDEMVSPDGTVLATELDIVVAGRTCFYQAGRNTDHQWRGGGSVLRTEIIRRAVAEGHREYDLLRGDESYKADWSEHRREVVRYRFGVGVIGRALAGAIRIRRMVLSTLRRLAPLAERLAAGVRDRWVSLAPSRRDPGSRSGPVD